jgi:hypothetical protein
MNERCTQLLRGKRWHAATVHRLFRRTELSSALLEEYGGTRFRWRIVIE